MDLKLESLKFLASSKGDELLEKYQDTHPNDLPSLVLKLAKQKVIFPSELASLLKLRYKASDKFTLAKEMFFTNDGLEQSSGELMSRYIANIFKEHLAENIIITDLTCGIGANSIFLAKFFKVRAIDIDEIHLRCAKYNANAYGVVDNIDFILGRAEDNVKNSEAYIIDPQRLREGRTKTRSIYQSEPKIVEILPKILEQTSNICLKISPAFDYRELENIPANPGVEIVSEGNVNKGAFLFFGKLKTAERKATIITANTITSFDDSLSVANLKNSEELKEFIYLANKAIIKARLIDQVATLYGLYKISEKNEFLSSDKLNTFPEKVFRTFRVLEQVPFSINKAQKLVKKSALKRAHIIARHFSINPEDLRERLKLKEGGEHSLIFSEIKGKKMIILAKNLS